MGSNATMTENTEYEFTEDWFHWAPQLLLVLRESLPHRNCMLEIGSYEGRSSVWIAENMLEDGGELVCIDTWEGGEEHSKKDMDAVYHRFHDNVAKFCKLFSHRYITSYKDKSWERLARLFDAYSPNEGPSFIYIDGSHKAKDVLTDACLAWKLLVKDGIMVFDDYVWGPSRDILHRPKMGVDAFLDTHAEELEILHLGYQVAVRKLV